MPENFATVYFDPAFVARANAGEWSSDRCPPWLKTGVLDFQVDSVQYRIKAGQALNLPEGVARLAIRRATFSENPLTGAPVRPLVLRGVLPGGVQSPFQCPACGETFDNYRVLATHLSDDHAEEDADEAAGESGAGADGVRPTAESPVGELTQSVRGRA